MSAPVLTNPSPVTPNACNEYWVTSITLSNPLLAAALCPFDGQYVIGNASKSKRIVADTSRDSAALAAVNAVFAQISRLSGNSAAVNVVTTSEADPLSPVAVTAVFADGNVYQIADLFALIAADSQAAAAYESLMSYLASK